MTGHRALLGLFVAGLLLQAGFAEKNNDSNKRPQPFQTGFEYVFEFNSQVAIGLTAPSTDDVQPQRENAFNTESNQGQNAQKSVARMQAKATINFITDNRATLHMSQLRSAEFNEATSVDLKRIQPMRIFKSTHVEEKYLNELQLPCDFVYSDGIVERINFHPQDSTWSKNIKRALLSHLQLNLKRKTDAQNQPKNQQSNWAAIQSSEEERQTGSYPNGQQQPNAFIVPEVSVQGICQTTYTINDNMNFNNNANQINDDNELNGQFNVTKSINFKNCRKIADVAFGFAPEESAQNAKCARHTQNANPNGRFAPSDDESCDPKELDQSKLDRSTVQRVECFGSASQKRCAIKRAEILSHYVLKNFAAQTADEAAPSAMHAIAVSELVFRDLRSASNPSKTSQYQLRDTGSSTEKCNDESHCSLLYDNEWERSVKQFYMHGDEQFNAQNSPFRQVTKKTEQAQHIFRKLIFASNEKHNVIESEVVALLNRYVKLLRMSTVEELKEIDNAVKNGNALPGQNSRVDAQKAEQLFADALAIAATRNTVHMLVHKIQNGEVQPEKAAKSLKHLMYAPAPSDSIASMIAALAKNELAHRTPDLQQRSWLTFGALVGRMCGNKIATKVQQREQQSQPGNNNNNENTDAGKQEMLFGTQSGFDKFQVCSPSKKDAYKQMLIKNYQQAQTIYDKVLALKAIGNAGLDNTVNDIEKIVNGQTRESPMVRAIAIDALRRLRTRMPRKIQRIVLPVFQNTNERPEVRMTAFSTLMNSQPEAHILDQILFTLSKERSRQVQSFVYSTAKSLSQSKVQQDQNNAKHLKSALQLSGLNEDEVSRESGKFELQGQKNGEGAVLKLISMYTDKQILPTQIAFGIDSIFNGFKSVDSVRFSIAQQGTESWLENIAEALFGSWQNGNNKMTRAGRSEATNSRRADQELREIFTSLNVKSRKQSPVSASFSSSSKSTPFVMASLRVADVDQGMFALDHATLSQPLRELLEKGNRAPIATIIHQLANQLENQHMHRLSAANVHEKWAQVPTSSGIVLKFAQATPVLSAFTANAKVQTNGQALDSSAKVTVNAHVSFTTVHLQKMEMFTPVASWGVMSKRALEFNVPIQAEIRSDNEESNSNKNAAGFQLRLKVPQAPKTRLFGAHSFAATYFVQLENMHDQIDAHTHNSIKMRSIRVPRAQQTLTGPHDMEEQCYGEQSIGVPVCVSGQYHAPTEPSNAAQWLQIAMATENDVHVSIKPNRNTPNTIVLQASASLFKQATGTQINEALGQLQKFYENADDSFHPAYPEEYEGMKMESYSDRRQKLEKNIQKLIQNQKQQSFYKHALKVSMKTEGGNKNANAQLRVQAVCDSRFRVCSIATDAEASPLVSQESQPWTLKSKMQILTPETVSSPVELQRLQSGKQQTFLYKMEAEWGNERKQNVNIRLQGNNAQPKNINEQPEKQFSQFSSVEIERQQQQKQRAASFINNYEAAVSYKLSPQTQNYFARIFDVVKAQNYWNSESQLKQSGRDGQIYGSLTIEPVSAQQVKLQVRTPSQIVKITELELPVRARLMPLIQHGEKSTHSIAQFLTRTTRDATRAECSVDQRRVETFDGARYKGPITNNCYSVLAKDCSNAEQPEFAVLMKSINANGQQKKIKVVTPEQVIECQAKQSAGEKKLECKINGQPVNAPNSPVDDASSSEEWQQHPSVEYNNEEQTSVTINAPSGAVSVRFACQCAGCECQKAWIQLANKHKFGQCGLCGHYDDTLADEWRMSNNEQTDDLAAFHRSYSMLSNDEGEVCTKGTQDSFYNANKGKFSMLRNEMDNGNESGFKSDEGFSSENEWQQNFGGYATEDSDEEFNFGGFSQKQILPVMKTAVIEQSHQTCLSAKPVKQCPTGTVPATSNEDSAWDSEDEGEQTNVEFLCMERSDAYPYLRDIARKGVAANIKSEPAVTTKFSKMVRQPRKCQRF